jgi:hypothetical protein
VPRACGTGRCTRSNPTAMPSPTPMHVVHSAQRPPAACSWLTAVVVRRAPLAPSGWPSLQSGRLAGVRCQAHQQLVALAPGTVASNSRPSCLRRLLIGSPFANAPEAESIADADDQVGQRQQAQPLRFVMTRLESPRVTALPGACNCTKPTSAPSTVTAQSGRVLRSGNAVSPTATTRPALSPHSADMSCNAFSKGHRSWSSGSPVAVALDRRADAYLPIRETACSGVMLEFRAAAPSVTRDGLCVARTAAIARAGSSSCFIAQDLQLQLRKLKQQIMFSRTAHSRLLRQARGFPVVVLTGPRQSSKTTLARAAMAGHAYVSL